MEIDCKIRGHAHRSRFSKYRNLHVNIGLPSAIAATMTGALVTVGVNTPKTTDELTLIEIFALALSWLVAALTATNSFLKPYETSQGHIEKSVAYDVLLSRIGKAQVLNADDEQAAKLEEITQEIEKLKKSEPFLGNKRIEQSRKQLQKDRENEQSEESK